MNRPNVCLYVCFAVAWSILQAAPSSAAPVAYNIQMTGAFDGSGVPHPILNGANISITYLLDTTGLGPGTSLGDPSVTWWDTIAHVTHVSVVLGGTAASDGAYPAAKLRQNVAFVDPSPWILQSSPSGGSISFPAIEFTLDGSKVVVRASANLDGVYTETGISYPKAFAASQASDWIARINTTNPNTQDLATNVSGYAYVVPEPSTLALGSFALLSLAVLRRRM